MPSYVNHDGNLFLVVSTLPSNGMEMMMSQGVICFEIRTTADVYAQKNPRGRSRLKAFISFCMRALQFVIGNKCTKAFANGLVEGIPLVDIYNARSHEFK
ncbi:hypothetical protein NPIL_689821 [Nephila pilipes]|uniref:Uncharacterized protein n=1 Tax=Nephila pilipes TaxID=299642 RepID=A0A8X6PD06_NEPPI|nr:hypothetical protein NPIL_689821 [Nephila pilipes]